MQSIQNRQQNKQKFKANLPETIPSKMNNKQKSKREARTGQIAGWHRAILKYYIYIAVVLLVYIAISEFRKRSPPCRSVQPSQFELKWSPLKYPNYLKRKVRSTQNAAACLSAINNGSKRRDHVCLLQYVLRRLHWLPVYRRVQCLSCPSGTVGPSTKLYNDI